MATAELILKLTDLSTKGGATFHLYLGSRPEPIAWVLVMPLTEVGTTRRTRTDRAVDVVSCFPGLPISGKVMSLPDALSVVSRLGLDPQPVLEAARELGWEVD